MITSPTTGECPTDDLLRRLLDDLLEQTEANRLADHVDGCPECQDRLEVLTTDVALRSVHRDLTHTGHQLGEGFLRDLLAARPSIPTEPVELPDVSGYQVIRELGRGGMGVVYLARQHGLNRLVALKLVHACSNQEVRKRFRREADAVGRLRHPHVVQVYEVGETGGWPFLALEYVDGQQLNHATRGTPVPPREAAELVETLARAMHVAHRMGIIHRDLKPANILMTTDGIPKIADFGLAKLLEGESDGATHSGQLLGTPSYVAPEQVAGHGVAGEITAATDVYALGAILYELLTGRPPFRAALPVDTLLQVLHHDPVRPSQLQPNVPRDLETICLACLSKSPERRYPSAEALADDLRRFQDGREVKARPIGRFGRLRRWARRNPSAAALIAVIGMSVVAAASGFAWLWREAEVRANLEAEAHRTADALVTARDEKLASEEQSLRASRHRAADLAVGRYLAMCQEGEVARGMLGLAETAAALPADEVELDWLVRANLDAWRFYHVPRRQTLAHPDRVTAIAYSPDQRFLATACQDGAVRLWDAASGERVGPELRHDAPVTAIAIAFSSNSLVSASRDGSTRVWEIPSGRRTGEIVGHTKPVVAVAFRPDGNRFATVSSDKTARIWATDTAEMIGTAMRHPDGVEAVAFTPDGHRLLTGCGDGSARIWDAETGDSRGVIAPRHRSPVGFVAVAPYGTSYATGSATDLIGSLPPLPGKTLVRNMNIHEPVTALAYDPRGGFLVTGGGSIENATGITLRRITGPDVISLLLPFEGTVRSLGVGPRCERVLIGGDHWRATLLLEPFELNKPLRLDHPGNVSAVAFSPDFQRIASAAKLPGKGGVVYVWDAPPSMTGSLTLPHPKVSRIMVGSENRMLTLSTSTARCWNASQGQAIGEPWACTKPKLTAWDGRERIWTVRGDEVIARNALTGEPLPIKIDCPTEVAALAATPDGKAVVIADAGSVLRVYRVDVPNPTCDVLDNPSPCEVLAVSSNGLLASGGIDGKVQLWNVSTRQAVGPPLKHESPIRALTFNQDGSQIAVGCRDKTIRVWDCRSHQSICEPIITKEVITELAWQPLGRLLNTVCLDGTSRFWDTITGKPVGPALLWKATTAAFSPDGKSLFTGSPEREVRSVLVPTVPPLGRDEILPWVKAAIGVAN